MHRFQEDYERWQNEEDKLKLIEEKDLSISDLFAMWCEENGEQ
jgi:hypothetical protein